MRIKNLLKPESYEGATLLAAFILCFVLPFSSAAQSPAQSLPNSLNLTIELGGAYNSGFKLCTPIFVNDQLEFSWTRGLVQSSISALVSDPEDGSYPVKFKLREGMLGYTREVILEPRLELEKPYQSITQLEGGFEISYKQKLVVSTKDCR